jgi:hypothetical protein
MTRVCELHPRSNRNCFLFKLYQPRGLTSTWDGWPEFSRQNFESIKYWTDFSVIDLPNFRLTSTFGLNRHSMVCRCCLFLSLWITITDHIDKMMTIIRVSKITLTKLSEIWSKGSPLSENNTFKEFVSSLT